MQLTWTPKEDDTILEGAVKAISGQHLDVTNGRLAVDLEKHVGDLPGAVAVNKRLYALAEGKEVLYLGAATPEARSTRQDGEANTYGEEWLVRTAAKNPAADPAYVGLVCGRSAAWATKALAAAAPPPMPTGATSPTNPPPSQNATSPPSQGTTPPLATATSTQTAPASGDKAQLTSGNTKAANTSDASGAPSQDAK